MAITELPTRTEDSLGQTKEDRPRPLAPAPDPRYDVPAAQYNRVLDLLVALAESLGLDDGSTPDSVREAVAALQTDVAASGRVLFQWNGTDLTQFDTNTILLSAGTDLTPVCDVVDSTISPGSKAIRLRATGTLADGRNGFLSLLVKTSEFTVPASRRYVIEMRIAGHVAATANRQYLVGPLFLSGASAGNPYQNLVGIYDTGVGGALRHYRRENASIIKGSATPAFAATLAATEVHGAWLRMEVIGKEGSPPTWRLIVTGAGAGDASVAHKNQDQTPGASGWNITAMAAAWNAMTLDRVGLGLGITANGATLTDPYYEICEFRILKHPADE